MSRIQKIMLGLSLAAGFTACKKDTDPIITVSDGVERIQLNGIAGSEPGSVAANSVYLDFSNEKATPALRAGWDLGFYSGSDFRVILNNTTSAGAKVTSKFDMNTVTTADTAGFAAANITLATSQFNPLPTDLPFFDDIEGDLNKTVIPAVSATDGANPVVIMNRGTGGSIAARPWIKLRVLRNSTGGYTIQYAPLASAAFTTISIDKDAAYNFRFLSFDNGIVNPEPKKAEWDLRWSYSVYQANFGAGNSPYNFSDMIDVNYLANVQVKQKIYADETAATAAYNSFNMDSVNNNPVSSGRWTIGSNWRSTQPATGARKDRFYIIKDPQGNYYKFKCLAMGVGTDGGTRGKPEFKYNRIL